MAHPLCWTSSHTFDPLGHEAAISLTEDLSPEQSADILLLRCRNPQHILYTLSTDVTCPPTPRKIDLTCCDTEAAVLARDIILFTLLEDNASPNHIWEIIYHPKLTEHAFDLLISHSQKLSELAESPATWRESKYGPFIKMVDQASLSELRHMWAQYAEFPSLRSDRHEKLQAELEANSAIAKGREGVNPHLGLSAAGMWPEAITPVNEQFVHYWAHGTIATAKKDIEKASRLNPTFCYSTHGESFNLDNITFPMGYHFAPAFTPLVLDPVGPTTNSAMAKAKQQFKAGCLAFQASRKADSIVFRYFVGDAVMLCRALSLYNKTKNAQTGEFKSHWRATPIDLTEHVTSSPPAPDSFDVIECSNLSNKIGLFNLLLVGQPLLKQAPASQSVLYTESFFYGDRTIQIFWRRLCSNVPAIGLLLGLAPRPYLSLFSSRANAHTHAVKKDLPLFSERIPWVNPSSGDKHTSPESNTSISFEANHLALLLFDIYYEMTHYETTPLDKLKDGSCSEFLITNDPHFTQETFAIFVAHVKNRVRLINSTWPQVIDRLNTSIACHGTKYSLLNHLYDLQHQLHLHDVVSLQQNGLFEELFDAKVCGIYLKALSRWPTVPRLLCVVLIVPSAKLEPLREKWTLDPSPRLVCEYGVDYDVIDHTHSSIHAVWGKCVPMDDSDDKYVIDEDPEGFRGTSDLIVSFWTGRDAVTPPGVRIWLRLRDTHHAVSNFKDVLGPKLRLFETNLTDEKHVLLLRERPMGLSQTQKADRYIRPPPNFTTGDEYQIKAEFKDPKNTILPIVARVEIHSDFEKAQLSRAKKVEATQIGSCSLELAFGTSKRVLRFPYPISGTNIGININKNAYRIEVTAPISKPIETGGHPFSPFPVVQHSTPSPWNIHHVHIDRMPKVDIRQQSKIKEWLVCHTALQMSDRERSIQRSTPASNRRPSDALTSFKQSMTGMVLNYVGIRNPSQGRRSTFALIEPTHGMYTIIMVAGLRLDLSGLSFVLDCAIFTISPESAAHIERGIMPLQENGFLEIPTYPVEVHVWKHILPAFVERGRTWAHKADCRYKSEGRIPLSDEIDRDPLCQCGRGIGFDGPDWGFPAWKQLLPHATRAVLSPLFGVPYLEMVAGSARNTQDKQAPASQDQSLEVCWKCGGSGRPLLRCARCKKARYCSKDCQKIDWKEHKKVCK